jgi:hypothetical protein
MGTDMLVEEIRRSVVVTGLEPGRGPGRRRVSRGRSPRVAYRVTLEETGELLEAFNAPDYEKGETGALYAAARFATAQARGKRAVHLEGPEGFATRRYAPEYLGPGVKRPYRVPCSEASCPNWVHPVNPRQRPLCREHYRAAIPEEQIEHMSELGRQRRKS